LDVSEKPFLKVVVTLELLKVLFVVKSYLHHPLLSTFDN
jgi:hypothetical protein